MKDEEFIAKYYQSYQQALFTTNVTRELLQFRDLCAAVRATNNKLILAGNGASSSIASHGATDFTKQAKVRALTFHDHNLITAFSNDYGYNNWLSAAISAYFQDGDVVVLISSSGKSENIVSAARKAIRLGLPLVTFTGFSDKNPLRALGTLNFYLDSRAYNIVEAVHGIWLTMVVDLLVGSLEYSVS
jgi:D-sedoheptulose 7-phosphate isomerase